MSSNPDGSTTCSFAMAEETQSKYDVKKLNDGDWAVVLFRKQAAE